MASRPAALKSSAAADDSPSGPQYRGAVDATAARCSLPAPGGARSAAILRRDPVRCPGTPTVTGERLLEPRRGVIDEPCSEPGPAARLQRRHTRRSRGRRRTGRRPARRAHPAPESRPIAPDQQEDHQVVGAENRPGHRAAAAPLIQRDDPEQAGHGGDLDAGGGHLRRPCAATISSVPITSDASTTADATAAQPRLAVMQIPDRVRQPRPGGRPRCRTSGRRGSDRDPHPGDTRGRARPAARSRPVDPSTPG